MNNFDELGMDGETLTLSKVVIKGSDSDPDPNESVADYQKDNTLAELNAKKTINSQDSSPTPWFPNSPLLNRIPWGKPGTTSTIRILNRDAKTRAKVAALLDRLRNLRNRDGHLVQAALLLRKIERSGYADHILISATSAPREARAHGDTGPVNITVPQEKLDTPFEYNQYGTVAAADRGESTDALIKADIDSISGDDVAMLAHEFTHAIQFLVAAASTRDPSVEEEATRIGNEAFEAIHDPNTSNTNETLQRPIDAWNMYIPWRITPDKSY